MSLGYHYFPKLHRAPKSSVFYQNHLSTGATVKLIFPKLNHDETFAGGSIDYLLITRK